MSASRKREERASKLEKKLQKEAENKKEQRKYKTRVIAIVTTLIVAAILTLLFTSNLFYNKVAAVKINKSQFSLAEYGFYYQNAYNDFASAAQQQYGDYAEMFLPDKSSSFKEQYYNPDEGITWDEKLDEYALEKMQNTALMCDLAKEAGFRLIEEDYAVIDDEVANVQVYANNYGYSGVDQMLGTLYGKGMNEKLFRQVYERYLTAQLYEQDRRDSYEFSEDEIDNYYKENSEKYDNIVFRTFYVASEAVAANEEDKDTEEFRQGLADAKKKAEEMASKVTDEQSFIDLTREYCKDSEKDYYADDEYTKHDTKIAEINNVYKNWLIDESRKQGDVTVIESYYGSYVVYYIERVTPQYPTVDLSYALVSSKIVYEEDYDDVEAYNEAKAEALADAMETAQEIYQKFINEGATKESLKAVAEEYKDTITSQREMEQIAKGNFSGDAINEWIFDPARKPGDHVLVEGTLGAYIVYYENENTLYSRVLADNDMRSDKITEWKNEYLDDYDPSKTWVFKLR